MWNSGSNSYENAPKVNVFILYEANIIFNQDSFRPPDEVVLICNEASDDIKKCTCSASLLPSSIFIFMLLASHSDFQAVKVVKNVPSVSNDLCF